MTDEANTATPRREVAWGPGPPGTAMGRVVGFFDQECARLLEERAGGLPEGGGLVLNLSAVEYLSSTGIGEIVALASRFRLVIAEPSEPAMRLLSLADVLPLLDVAATEAEALARLAGPDPPLADPARPS
jgi:anti-anti-sigma regulatory factor